MSQAYPSGTMPLNDALWLWTGAGLLVLCALFFLAEWWRRRG